MTDTPALLDPLTFPLHGCRLIEASAGTGKTYTIAALYLRLILGHGGENAFPAALLPTQILVATFTDAAASELRSRIRARLTETARVLRGEHEGDALSQALRDELPVECRAERAHRLELAAEWMDEAVISTIHGWCQRMLREHAFDSGSLFALTLQTDHSALLAETTRDFWRAQCYPLQGEALDWVAQNWQTPDVLREKLKDLLRAGAEEVAENSTLAALLDAILRARAQALESLKAPWRLWVEALQAFFDAASEARKFNGNKWRPSIYNPRLNTLRRWCDDPQATLSLASDYFKRLSHEGLRDACASGVELTFDETIDGALRDFATLPQRLAALPDPAEAALRHAAAWIRRRFAREKKRRGEIGFDDMLTHLDDALRGEGGERLAGVIRRQFPVALIDEFQDTDPLQYRIFDRVYEVAAKHRDRGLFLIGDPKQAIYAFRGADIHTYLRARRATAGRHYSLSTNFRSGKDMVAAVNRLFLRAEQREGEGAFGFRGEEGNALPFVEVAARGRDEIWKVEDQPQAALTIWRLQTEKEIGKGNYTRAMAERAAREITRLLNLGAQGRAGFFHGGQTGASGRLTALRPSDIAVLVRDRNEAKAIRAQLFLRGVRSVYLSDQDSVFDSQEARDLWLWLVAAAAPENDRALRAALASRTLDLDLAELATLTRDERRWEARVLQFRAYRQRWRTQGVLPMLRCLLHDFALPARLMRQTTGERALTNLLHLSELLQQAAVEREGEQALIRYLGECLTGGARAADQQIVRLESDEALVRVVTIHKAKGLEYPLVFLPFVCAFRPLAGDQPFVTHDGECRRVVFRADDALLRHARHERLGEDLRLLYVALTRARHACWLGVADLSIGVGKRYGLAHSALGYLLDIPNTPLAEALKTLAAAPEIAARNITETEMETERETRYRPPVVALPSAPVWRAPRRHVAEHWWIASYSALRMAEDDSSPSAETPVLRHDDAAPESLAMQNASDDDACPPSPVARSRSSGMHHFPRGPNPGTFLHGLLEMAAAEGFSALAADPARLREQVARRCQRRGLTAWIPTLSDWLLALLRQPLPLGEGRVTRLAELVCPQSEMEFWFETRHVNAGELDRRVRQSECPGHPRPSLCSSDLLNGMFKGFIDLAFERDGRYYVADYKSNWLGENDAAYTPEALRAAMLEHRYDLQYTLYLLALHRQLTLRLPDYDYDRHMGGALYLFLRAPAQGVYLARPPRALIEGLDALFRGEREARPA